MDASLRFVPGALFQPYSGPSSKNALRSGYPCQPESYGDENRKADSFNDEDLLCPIER
jgi:hypothetical protein